jgi:putative ABC transport system permease protein
MTSFFEDLRLAARTLRRRPGLPAVIVATLGLAIGANAAVFSFVDSLLLRPLPVEAQERLVRIYSHFASGLEWASVSYPNYLDFQRGNRVFSALAADTNQALVVGDSASSQLALGALVSANWFSTLGVRPALGRAFRPEEERVPSAVAVVADGFWRHYLGADPRVLGRTLQLNGTPFKIVGVAPLGFRGPNTGLETEVWVPISMQRAIIPGGDLLALRDSNWLQLTGRLRPGVTLAQAREAMNALAAQLRRLYPKDNEGVSLTLLPESQARIYPVFRGGMVALSALLQLVVGLVLAVACANAAGLLLARGTARRREIAIRLALGARTGRLVRMLVTESLVLGLVGGATGLVLAFGATRLFGSFSLPMQLPMTFRIEVDSRVLVLTLGVALATGVLFGLVPALQITRPRLAMAIREGGADAGPRRSRLRGALVVGQIAATFVLLVGASLFFRSLRNVETTDLGFRTQGLLVASLNLGYAGYGKAAAQRFLERLEARLRELPGVRAVSLATRLPLSLMHRTVDAAPEGYVPPHAGEGKPEIDANWVAPDYFKTMEIPLVAGREFTPADRQGTQPVALVNEALARRFFPAGQALGRRLVAGDTPHLVVGVVRDGKQLTLQGEQQPYVYFDLYQEYEPAVTLHLRTAGDAAGLIPALRREVRALDPRVALFDVKPMARQLDFSLLPQRLAGALLAAMGALALALALLGLYAATAYALARRTREIGIRIALGAGHRQLLALLLRGGAGQCALGLAIGLAAALLFGRLAASLLFGVSPTDATSLAATAALVSGLALVANLIPAVAALQLDPRQALAVE